MRTLCARWAMACALACVDLAKDLSEDRGGVHWALARAEQGIVDAAARLDTLGPA